MREYLVALLINRNDGVAAQQWENYPVDDDGLCLDGEPTNDRPLSEL